MPGGKEEISAQKNQGGDEICPQIIEKKSSGGKKTQGVRAYLQYLEKLGIHLLEISAQKNQGGDEVNFGRLQH